MNEQAELFNFEEQFDTDNSPEDLTQVTTTILYFSEEDTNSELTLNAPFILITISTILIISRKPKI